MLNSYYVTFLTSDKRDYYATVQANNLDEAYIKASERYGIGSVSDVYTAKSFKQHMSGYCLELIE